MTKGREVRKLPLRKTKSEGLRGNSRLEKPTEAPKSNFSKKPIYPEGGRTVKTLTL
ncbi:hypothetical protein HAT2_00378 [Candidatus Similichlamydia laticola]|uniref:Uncharacterized protein n=1 Tax=Candidatus Similichlamydia laticola TaxID=2170265 RepID=A0A369KIA3_9BACT|nr:hypothetical protein HAT2_00378 [Candidatus Similichlamydia laticola]